MSAGAHRSLRLGLGQSAAGTSTSTVKRWLEQADVDDGIIDGLTTAEQNELVELRRKSRRLEQENEILRRAAAYFAKDALPK